LIAPAATNGLALKLVNRDDVLQTIRLFVPAGGVTEVRALEAAMHDDRGDWTKTYSGYFDDPVKLADAVTMLRKAKGIFFVFNEVTPALLARAANRLKATGKDDATGDGNITRRRWLLIDCDATRPTSISSTDEEHDAALEKAQAVDLYLHDRGWPDPIVCDSGNGGHLLYRVDLPADDGGLVSRCLTALAAEFDDDAVNIDQKVFNAARITKLYGTLVCKGDNTIDRPHRMARIINAPETPLVVQLALLEELAGPAAAPQQKPAPHVNGHAHNGSLEAFDVAAFIARNNLDVMGPSPWNGGQCWEFNVSPMCEHGGDGPFIGQFPSGAVVARCHHNSCNWEWRDLRAKVEPKAQYNGAASRAGNQLANSPVENPFSKRVDYQRITSKELASGDFEVEYLIENTLAKGQPLLIVGQQKVLKTSLGIIDAAVSLASGGYFLGKFRVNRPCRVAVMSGESGLATIQETAKRVCAAAGQWLDELDNLIWTPDLPKFGDPAHLDALARFIDGDGIEVLFIDPAYLAMPGADAGNLMIQGELLRSISDLCRQREVTLGLAHHTKKSTGRDPFDIPELSDIAWSGFAEFARQWWLLGRRERYEPGTGNHKLWLSIGGSAGHSALWAVDVAEGLRTDPNGRRWEVSVKAPSEAREESETGREQQREQQRASQVERRLMNDKSKVQAAMVALNMPETGKVIRTRAGISGERFAPAIAALMDDGAVEACQVTKPPRKTPIDGFKLKDVDIPC